MGTERRARKEKARAGFDQPGEARGAGGGGAGVPGCCFQPPKGGLQGRQSQAPGSKSIRGHGCESLRGKSQTPPSVPGCPHCPPGIAGSRYGAGRALGTGCPRMPSLGGGTLGGSGCSRDGLGRGSWLGYPGD